MNLLDFRVGFLLSKVYPLSACDTSPSRPDSGQHGSQIVRGKQSTQHTESGLKVVHVLILLVV